MIKFLALFSLNSGAILRAAMASLNHHDLRLLPQLWVELKAGDVLLGDRAYGAFITLATLPRRGVDVVARLNHRRQIDFRKARRLAKNDACFVWFKRRQPSKVCSF